jgi:nucleoside 2-deoxyribosyltransferase
MEASVYLAGPLFNVGERRHNSELERSLNTCAEKQGITLKITSPQKTAINRLTSQTKGFDVRGIVADCIRDSANHDVILCNLDGPDADSGTSVEYGIALGQAVAARRLSDHVGAIKTPLIITYRTDFRTAHEKEVGVNAMLMAEGTKHVYIPCFATEEDEFNKFYDSLASQIIGAIKKGLS